jgi:hypothetical protein
MRPSGITSPLVNKNYPVAWPRGRGTAKSDLDSWEDGSDGSDTK